MYLIQWSFSLTNSSTKRSCSSISNSFKLIKFYKTRYSSSSSISIFYKLIFSTLVKNSNPSRVHSGLWDMLRYFNLVTAFFRPIQSILLWLTSSSSRFFIWDKLYIWVNLLWLRWRYLKVGSNSKWASLSTKLWFKIMF